MPATFWLAALVFCTLTTAWFTAFFEWEHYRRLVWSLGVPPTRWDRVVLAWLLWWKSLILFLPLLLACGLLAWRHRLRAATALLLVGWTVVMFWLVADLRLQQVLGSHVLDYLPYLYDALAMPLEANHTEWSGDNSGILMGGALVLAAVIASGYFVWRACVWTTRRWISRWLGLTRFRGQLLAATAYLLFLVGIVPAQALMSTPLVLRQIRTTLPVDVSWLDDCTSLTLRCLGQDRATRLALDGVRIVSLLPNPAGADAGREEVHLHNFTPEPVDLQGWWMRDAASNVHRLSGVLPAGETRVLTLPSGVMPLNNAGDQVSLHDALGTTVHQVSYHRQEAKYGGVINFRQAGDFNAFEVQLNTSVLTAYQSMYSRITSARDMDRQAVVRPASPPNVIYLVLESFRHTAMSPRLMSKLHAWSQGGLRFSRHYAGSNASHFGLFTLLYSRSPLAYDPCLDAKVPPQTVHTLKQSGYQCYFLTAGDCRGFRRMGEFLSEEYFDGVITDHGETWLDRVDRDRRTLARVKKLATAQPDQPRFIMAFLMSTHFPYTFPPEFEVHRPSGKDVSYVNWKRTDHTVLYNRYKNAALFLEDEISKLIESLDPRRNIILITGDHGESMSEDGALAHGSRGSEIQTRVPLVMVGPGVPAREVPSATTHADVLPTLLHVLAGRPVPLKHVHGRDMLSGASHEDRALICPYRWKDPYDLLLIRGTERLQLKFRLDRAEIQVVGFCDEAAKLCFQQGHDVSPRAASEWAEAFRRELTRIAK